MYIPTAVAIIAYLKVGARSERSFSALPVDSTALVAVAPSAVPVAVPDTTVPIEEQPIVNAGSLPTPTNSYLRHTYHRFAVPLPRRGRLLYSSFFVMVVVALVRLFGGADGVDGGFGILCTVNGTAGDEDVGAGRRHERGRLGVDAAVDFNVAIIAEVVDFMREHVNFVERRRDKFLPANS